MAVTVFKLDNIGTESISVLSTSPGFNFTLTKISGDAIDASAVIGSAVLNIDKTFQYSNKRLWVTQKGGADMHASKSTSGNSASSNVQEPLSATLYKTNFYTGLESLPIVIKGAGKGSSTNDGNVFQIRGGAAITITVNWTPTSATGAPTNATVPAVSEGAATLSYSGAYSGANNAITGYEIQYADSANGSSWGAWNALKTVSNTGTSGTTSVDISATRGAYRKYRIRTRGAAGAAYYSAWKESNVVRKNSVPSAPTTATASPTPYESGGVLVAWSGATDVDGNITAYEVQRAASVDGASWGAWGNITTTATGGSYTDWPTIARGEYVKYRVRAVDAFGVASGYKESAKVRRNRVPAATSINHPAQGAATINIRPRFLITLGAEPDGQTQTLAANGYTPSSPGPYASGRKIVLRKSSNAAVGTNTATVTPTDSQGAAGASASRGVAYGAAVWTDELKAGSTPIKAAHMTELRAAINAVRVYYGLSAVVWSEAITAGQTSMAGWAGHVAEMRTAINGIVTRVNDWDVPTLTVPSWIAIVDKQPRADVMEQIRSVLGGL